LYDAITSPFVTALVAAVLALFIRFVALSPKSHPTIVRVKFPVLRVANGAFELDESRRGRGIHP